MGIHDQKGFSVIEGLVVVLVFAVVAGAGVFIKGKINNNSRDDSGNKKVANVDVSNPPKFVEHEFIDLSAVFSISKFRSAEGHDFSDGSETCRSMKHYFNQQYNEAYSQATAKNNGMPPGPDGKTDVAIYSPVNGTIVEIASERMPIGEQIYIVPDKAKDYTVRLFHIYKSSNIQKGSRVTAGQQIGSVPKGQNTDISVETKQRYVSYFTVMTDSIFAAYAERGVTARDDVILTKEYRDAHPVPCDQEKAGNQQFTYPAGYDHANDIVKLSGYIDPASMGHYETYTNKQ